jgi:hypothetical protein
MLDDHSKDEHLEPAGAGSPFLRVEPTAGGKVFEEIAEAGLAQSMVVTVLAAVVVLTGVGYLMFTFFSGNSTPSNQTASTAGTVLSCETLNNSGSFNVVSFEVNDKTYSALTRVGTRYPCVYTDGQRVTVTYDPSDPSSASVSNGPPFTGVDFGKIVVPFLVLSALSTAFAIFRRRRRSGSGGTTITTE